MTPTQSSKYAYLIENFNLLLQNTDNNTTQCSKIMPLKNNFKIFKALGSKINNAI